MFRRLGNILANSAVGLLFIDFEAQQRLRVNGRATLHLEDELKRSWPGAQGMVRVKAQQIFPNCPRYIHRMTLVEPSAYVPEAARPAPVPGWKRNLAFKDYLPQEG